MLAANVTGYNYELPVEKEANITLVNHDSEMVLEEISAIPQGNL